MGLAWRSAADNRHGDLTLKRGFDAAYFAVSVTPQRRIYALGAARYRLTAAQATPALAHCSRLHRSAALSGADIAKHPLPIVSRRVPLPVGSTYPAPSDPLNFRGPCLKEMHSSRPQAAACAPDRCCWSLTTCQPSWRISPSLKSEGRDQASGTRTRRDRQRRAQLAGSLRPSSFTYFNTLRSVKVCGSLST